MVGGAWAALARTVRQLASQLWPSWLRSAGEPEREFLASYSAPSRRSNQPPYASLRQ